MFRSYFYTDFIIYTHYVRKRDQKKKMNDLILKRFTRSKDRSIVAMESNADIEIR